MSDATVDYRQMWADLGLNLPAHCALLDAIPQMYGDAYLDAGEPARGHGATSTSSCREIHGLRIKELQDHKAAGGKVVGTFCLYVPEEIIRALGASGRRPVRRRRVGLRRGRAASCRATPARSSSRFMGFKLGTVCPYVESADLVIGETTCDGKKKAYELLRRDGAGATSWSCRR